MNCQAAWATSEPTFDYLQPRMERLRIVVEAKSNCSCMPVDFQNIEPERGSDVRTEVDQPELIFVPLAPQGESAGSHRVVA